MDDTIQIYNWASEASPPSGTTGTIFLYIYNYICVVARSVRVAGYRIVSKCFYALLFRRPRGEKYRTAMLHSLSRSPTMLKHSSSIVSIDTRLCFCLKSCVAVERNELATDRRPTKAHERRGKRE